MAADDFQVATEAFLSWLSSNGIRINPKMVVKDFRPYGRGRGVVAAANFEEDEVVFSIPRSAVLNVKNALPGSATQWSKDAIQNMPSWLALTALMIAESQRPSSKWLPYLAILPRQLDSLVFWSESERIELQASKVTSKIGKESAEEMFAQHLAPLELGECNNEMYHRVASIIMAYAFDIPEDGDAKKETEPMEADDGDDLVSDDGEDEKTVLSMIPLADMLNADADRNNARLCCDNEDLEMRTIKPIAEGEEIFNDYGLLPRSDLLRRYGYITDNYAPYDVAEISTASILLQLASEPVEISDGRFLEPLKPEDAERRTSLAEREGILEESYDLVHPSPEGPSIPDELIALVYLLLLDEDSLEVIENSQCSLPSRSKLKTEVVGQVLAVLLRVRQNEYVTTVEEDKKLLQASFLPRRTTMAIKVRQGEKVVLRKAIEECSTFDGHNKRMRIAQGMPNALKEGGFPGNKRGADEDTHTKKRGRYR